MEGVPASTIGTAEPTVAAALPLVASSQLDTALIFAALAVVSVLGLASYYVVELAERLLVPWAPKYEIRQRAA